MRDPFEAPESDAPRLDHLEDYQDLDQRLGQAEEAKVETPQASANSAGNLDLPDEAQPGTAGTERGTARRVETGPEKPEVKNFDVETGAPKPPKGWRPGGPEGGG